jgi:hypothetical protein
LSAVVLLALAMIPPTPDGFVAMYTPWAVAFAVAAALCAMAACVLPSSAWRISPLLIGWWSIVAASLLLAAHAGVLIVVLWGKAALWPEAFLALTAVLTAGAVGVCKRAPPPMPDTLLATVALGLSGEAVICSAVNPPYRDDALTLVRLASCIGFGVTTSLLIHLSNTVRRRLLFGVQVTLLFLAGALLRGAAAVAAPDPFIDVYYAIQEGADHLLAGANPYTAPYNFEGAPFYPPLPFLVGAPVRAVGLDVRLANALCDLVAAAALLAAAWQQGRRLPGVLLAAAYLNFPRVPLLMELAWYEPMLAAALGSGLVLVARGRRLGHLLLGLGVTGKQYGVFLLPPLVRAFRSDRTALLLGTASAGAFVLLPFLLWDAPAFLDRMLFWHARQPIRYDAITLQAAAGNLLGVVVPRPLLLAAAVVLIGWVTWRTPADGASPAAPMAAALLIFCLFHSQAFFNYFYLCQYLLFFGVIDWYAPSGEGPG